MKASETRCVHLAIDGQSKSVPIQSDDIVELVSCSGYANLQAGFSSGRIGHRCNRSVSSLSAALRLSPSYLTARISFTASSCVLADFSPIKIDRHRTISERCQMLH
jgi:hypothetical protein